jgi:microcystin-dependent protein
MSEPFLSEIRIMSFGYAPHSWAMCNGQLLPINQNQGLFSLLGTTYGGNGQTTFALPDLRGRVPIHTSGNSFTLGQAGGQQAHTITMSEMPMHVHVANATSAGATSPTLGGLLLADTAPNEVYLGAQDFVALHPGTLTNVGGSQAHQNMQPFLTLNFCIALQGIFPSQT